MVETAKPGKKNEVTFVEGLNLYICEVMLAGMGINIGVVVVYVNFVQNYQPTKSGS